MSTKSDHNAVLIIGLGELGTAIVEAILAHASFEPSSYQISVLIRQSTIDSPSAAKAEQLISLKSRHVSIVAGDLVASTMMELAELFRPYDTVIHAGSMELSSGTQLKITQAVLATGTVSLYVPWQFGVEYDAITRAGGQGIFHEQLDVRDLLRAQDKCQWFIVACGIFMSLLFEDWWSVVVRSDDKNSTKIQKVRALGGWDHLLTATTAHDIGRCTAELILVDKQLRNESIFIAGDSMLYSEFADLVEKINGQGIQRELWSTEYLRQEGEREPENKVKKYRVVFSEGKGLAWPKNDTYNSRKNIPTTGIEEYLRSIL